MLRIVIVGCGEIGSRHLQALAQLEESASIFLIDLSPDAVVMAKNRFEDVLQNNTKGLISVSECQFHEIGPEIDVAIIASGSRPRATLTQELLKYTLPKYIIFEKFLFAVESEYDEISELLASKNIKAWANQWMSSTYAFRRMASWLARESPVSIEISGDEWGLACNAVHFIELFDYLNDRGALTLTSCTLNDGMLPGKRAGYFEVTGEITIRSDNMAILEMVSRHAESDGLINIILKNGRKSIRATLVRGGVSCYYIDSAGSVHEDYIVPMQSTVTGKIIQHLMLSGECDLPEFNRSAYQHKLIVGCLDSHFREKCGWADVGCPIT